MWTAAAPPPGGLLCRGCLDSQGGCRLVTSGWSSAWRVPGKCSPRRPGATPPPGCEEVQPASPSALLPSFEAVALAGTEQGGEVPPPTTPEGHQQVAAAREPRGRSAVTSALPPGRSSLGRTGGRVTGRNAPQERARLSLVRHAPPAGRAEGRGGEGTAGRREEGAGSSVCGRGSRPVLRAGPGSLSMVLSFGVLRRLPLCRCECASRPGWAVGGPEGARGRHVRPGIPRVSLSSALSPRKGLRKQGARESGPRSCMTLAGGCSATPGPCGGLLWAHCTGNGVRGSPGARSRGEDAV